VAFIKGGFKALKGPGSKGFILFKGPGAGIFFPGPVTRSCRMGGLCCPTRGERKGGTKIFAGGLGEEEFGGFTERGGF